MMTEQIGFSILTAPLAAIDRRALSQAWYSALHLAQSPPHPSQPQAQRRSATQAFAGNVTARAKASGHVQTPSPRVARRAALVTPRAGAACDRRTERSRLGAQIERAFLRQGNAAQRTSIVVEGGRERVHLTLQRLSGGLTLVAVCSPRARDTVSRALNEARYALARRGISLTLALEDLACK